MSIIGKKCPLCKQVGHAKNSRLCKGKHKKKKTNRTEVSSSDDSSDESVGSDEENTQLHSVKSSGKILTISAIDEVHQVQSPENELEQTVLTRPQGKPARRIGNRRHRHRQSKKKIDFYTSVKINNCRECTC